MNKKMLSAPWSSAFANSVDAFIPEIWAQESLMILENNMVLANLVHRDFEDEIKQYGDVVNTRQVANFTAARKTDADEVSVQDADATNVAVPLDQHIHTSFMIKDGEESKGFKSLLVEYLEPAVISIAQAIDEILSYQGYQFLDNVVGKLGTTPTKSTVIAAREEMTNNQCPLTGRNLVVTPNVEGSLLDIQDFVNAEKVGDDGTALREGSLGRKFGFNTFTCQNMPSIAAGSTTVTGAVNLTAGYAVGATTIAVDGFSAVIGAGSYFTVAGDMIPQRVTSVVGAATPSSITFTPGLATAVVNNAVVTSYTPGAVNLTAGYDAEYAKSIVTDAFTVAPKIGQLVAFGGSTVEDYYGAMTTPTTTALTLDRPLDTALTNDQAINIGPAGEYSFAFHRNAIALVTRPLATPAAGTGALSYVASYNGLGIRVTITYDGAKQGHLVTVDLLAGIKVLNSDLGCVLLA